MKIIIFPSFIETGRAIYRATDRTETVRAVFSETRPRARQKRNVINVDNIARVPTVNERLRWDLKR